MPTWTAQLTFTSDWHIGVGAGRAGSLDRLVVRDADGLPCVPAKTLTGLWRDGCEQVAEALGDPWPAWVEALFGSQPSIDNRRGTDPPRPAALSIRPARLSAPLRARLLADDAAQLRSALTFAKPGVAIDSASGRAKDKHLRFEEMNRAGASLTTTVELDWTDPAAIAKAEALLWAGAQLVTTAGGKRRRGAGQCRLELAGAAAVDALVEQLQADPGTAPAPAAAAAGEAPATAATGTGWQRYELTLTAETPLVIASQVTGNVVESLDYVPGSLLLPILSAAWGAEARAAVADGRLRVGPAYRVVGADRGRPAPFCCEAIKGSTPFATERETLNGLRDTRAGSTQYKPVRDGYVGPLANGTLPCYGKVDLTSATHNTIEDAPQRPTAEVGGVYTYEAIATGTVLRAEVWLKGFTPGDVPVSARVGRSAKDDYGRVRLALSDVAAAPAPAPAAAGGTLTVWLQSDLLLRDARLRPAASLEALTKELETAFGVTLTVDEAASGLPAAWLRTRRTESWHRGWGLPRPSLVGLMAGCVVRYKVGGAVSADKLEKLQAEGLGERRAEGFGALSFNDPLLAASLVGLPTAKAAACGAPTAAADDDPDAAAGGAPAALEPEDEAYAKAVTAAAWRAAIRTAARYAAWKDSQREKILGWTRKAPPASQLGGLRELLGELDPTRVQSWLQGVRDNPKRANKWPSLQKVEALLLGADDIWAALIGFTAPGTLVGDEDALKATHWAYAVRTFLGEALRAERRAREHAPASNEQPAVQRGEATHD